MYSSLKIIGALGVIGSIVVVGLGTTPGTQPAVAAPARHTRPQTACAALGTYQIGPRVLPQRTRSGSDGPAVTTAQGPTRTLVWPGGLLRGTLTLLAYSGCGQPTSGTFSVQWSMVGPPILRSQGTPGRNTAVPCPMKGPCGVPVTGVISATGTLTQDAAHPGDPLYVTVGATITSARPGPMQGRPCSLKTGCPPVTVITSTATITQVTGYLQVTPDGQHAVLAFLPPPTGNTAPAALVLDGWRSASPRSSPPASR